MKPSLPGLSYRARILLVVFGVGVVPVALLGLWLVAGTARVGESVLRSRLVGALDQERTALEGAWVPYRSALLDYSETSADGAPAVDVRGLTLRDAAGRVLIGHGAPDTLPEVPPPAGILPVEIPLYDPVTGSDRGRLRALVPFLSLRPPSAAAALAGGIVTAADAGSGTLLLPVPFPPALLGRTRFEWNGEPWVVERMAVHEPRVELIAAAPLAPFTAPFREAARMGTLLLLAVTAAGVVLAAWLTHRLTSSLQQVTEAAEGVAAGDLERTLPPTRDDEVGRLARAFNRMTASLRDTLDALAGRESLEAVNEFAASLAHEVRNPLTAIQLDLQEVEESLPADSPLRGIQGRALEDVRRLDRAVEGALETARSGRVQLRSVDLTESIRNGIRAARPLARGRGVVLVEPDPPAPLGARADPDAVERVVHNLVRNAVQASPPGATVEVRAVAGPWGVVLRVRDEGEGIPAERAERVLEPFYSTRPGGTGIGLAVSRRIVAAHRGELEIRSEPGRGTEVRVRIPGAAQGGAPGAEAPGAAAAGPEASGPEASGPEASATEASATEASELPGAATIRSGVGLEGGTARSSPP